MKKQFLEAGEIVNTHGVGGEVRIQPWTNAPDFLLDFKTIYIDGKPVAIRRARVHKTCVIAQLAGVDSFDAANALRGHTVCINRDDAQLEDGQYFFQDLIGLPVLDAESGAQLGTLTDILERPAGDIFVITGTREILVPNVPEFIREIDTERGTIRVRLIEGM